jgi:hypothetical protein
MTHLSAIELVIDVDTAMGTVLETLIAEEKAVLKA